MSRAAVSYETEKMAREYLLFHYGSDQDLLPYPFGPQNSLHFPVRCVREALDLKTLSPSSRALELGCAVGRSSFELSRYCKQVVALDRSKNFISLAKRIQSGEEVEYTLLGEGGKTFLRYARRPENSNPERIEFRCSDVMALPLNGGAFDIVLAANLLCRLPNPRQFLHNLHHWVAPKGQLVLVSPYSWLEEYTPKENWLRQDGKSSLQCIQECIRDDFELSVLLIFRLLFEKIYASINGLFPKFLSGKKNRNWTFRCMCIRLSNYSCPCACPCPIPYSGTGTRAGTGTNNCFKFITSVLLRCRYIFRVHLC